MQHVIVYNVLIESGVAAIDPSLLQWVGGDNCVGFVYMKHTIESFYLTNCKAALSINKYYKDVMFKL